MRAQNFYAGYFCRKTTKGEMDVDVRTDYESGKLLFQWNPSNDVVSIAYKDTVYDIKLLHEQKGYAYEVIGKRKKPSVIRKNNIK